MSNVQARFFLAAIAAWLLGGAAYTFLTGQWFPAFPVQLDVAAFLGGKPAGYYIEAAIAAALGAPCLFFAVAPRRKAKSAVA